MSEEYRFNPNEHLMQLKSREGSKDYLPVQWRLVWFRETHPHGTIETEMLHLDLDRQTEEEVFAWNNEKRHSEKVIKQAKGFVVFKATVKDGVGGVATGTKSEKAASFGDFIEKAETGAIGRALAALGYGTQFAPELDEAHRIVDAPVDRAPDIGNAHSNASKDPNKSEAEPSTVTEQQVASIRKLCQYLNRSEPEHITSISFATAKQQIQLLTNEYKNDKSATSEQQASVRQMCEKLKKQPPAHLEKMKFQAAKRLLETLTGEYGDMMNKQNGHAAVPDIKVIRARCVKLHINFDELVTKKLGSNKADDNIIPEERTTLSQTLDIIEENRAKKAAEQQKAAS